MVVRIPFFALLMFVVFPPALFMPSFLTVPVVA